MNKPLTKEKQVSDITTRGNKHYYHEEDVASAVALTLKEFNFLRNDILAGSDLLDEIEVIERGIGIIKKNFPAVLEKEDTK